MSNQLLSHEISVLHSSLKTFTKRFTNDYDEALDLVQDTILKALMNQEKFREERNLRGWLFTIMRNIFINKYQKARRVRAFHEHTKELFFNCGIKDAHTFNDPASNLEYHEMWNTVNSLNNELLIPLKLYACGYKYHEIAKNQGIALGTVKNRIFKARQEIKKKLAEST
jgi:RNA polymerase sigma factor (sigma-70 family)